MPRCIEPACKRPQSRRGGSLCEQHRKKAEGLFWCCGGNDESPPQHTADCSGFVVPPLRKTFEELEAPPFIRIDAKKAIVTVPGEPPLDISDLIVDAPAGVELTLMVVFDASLKPGKRLSARRVKDDDDE